MSESGRSEGESSATSTQPGEASLESKIEAQREKLKEIIDIEFGLLAKLLSRKVLSHAEKIEIDNKASPLLKIQSLLDFILKNGKQQEFVETLKASGQVHVANWIEGNGVYKSEFNLDWPLTEKETDIITSNYEQLSDSLDTEHGFITELYSQGIVNRRLLESLNSERVNFKRNEAFLDALRRFSLKDYFAIANCLRKSNQEVMAEMLEDGGVAVPVHANLDGQNVEPAEEAIVTEMGNLYLRNNPIPEENDVNRLLTRLRLRILATRQGRSVVLYIRCSRTEEFQYLCTMVDDGEMKDFLDQLFNLLVQNLRTKVLSVTITENDIENAKASFKREALRDKTLDEHFRKLRSQLKHVEPMEVEERAVGAVREEKMEVTSHTEAEHVFGSMSVSQSSEETKKCQTEFEERRAQAMSDEEIVAAIIRNNSDFFKEHIKPSTLVPKLASLGMLSDEHRRYIRSMKNPRDKNYEILNIVRASSVGNYHKFIECLKQSGQSLVADVAEKGGVVLKVKVVHEPMDNIAEIEQRIATELNQLQDRNSPKSDDLWHFLSHLKVGGMEIMSARHDRGVITWLWCRSGNAVAKLEKLSKEEQLGRLFSALFCLLVPTVPKISNVYLDNTDIDVVSRRLPIWSVQTSATMSELKISGIAMLENKIIVVCKPRSTLLVFSCDEKGNAIPEKEASLKEIETPMHVTTSVKSRCLYITDDISNVVWKVSIGLQGEIEGPKVWLDRSADRINSLSVGINNNVLLLRQSQPSRLEFYDADGKLERPPLALPALIVNPHHVAEASNGDLIISYDSSSVHGGICRITGEGRWVARLELGFSRIEKLSNEANVILSSMSEKLRYLKSFDHFTMDDKDQVYACNSDQIIVLDSGLYVEKINEGMELKNSCVIHYFKDEGKLVLVHGVGQNLFSVMIKNITK